MKGGMLSLVWMAWGWVSLGGGIDAGALVLLAAGGKGAGCVVSVAQADLVLLRLLLGKSGVLGSPSQLLLWVVGSEWGV